MSILRGRGFLLSVTFHEYVVKYIMYVVKSYRYLVSMRMKSSLRNKHTLL